MSLLATFQNTLQSTNKIAQPLLKASNSANGLSSLIVGQPTTPNQRLPSGITNRRSEIMSFRLPSGAVVEMYINPQNLTIAESKAITPIRTKGGYVIQYWGDQLTEITLSGHTGSSGIKGIQILRDIYRSENKGFDLVAATQQSELQSIIGETNIQDANMSQTLSSYSAALQKRNYLLRPSLASMAVSVILFYQGVQYKGFFTAFETTENTDQLGLISYTMRFSATSTSGQRQNFMAWHKEPIATDLTGQLLNSAGNAIRGALGLGAQPPQQFHPEDGPYTFGSYPELVELGIAQNTSSTQRPGGVNIGVSAVNRNK